MFVKSHGLSFPLLDRVMGRFAQLPAKGRVCQISTGELLLNMSFLLRLTMKLILQGAGHKLEKIELVPSHG